MLFQIVVDGCGAYSVVIAKPHQVIAPGQQIIVDRARLTFSSSASSATFRSRGEVGISRFGILRQSSIFVPLKIFSELRCYRISF
jgi:hypothetical protein